MKKKIIVLTGANGFLGNKLTYALVNKNFSVIGIINSKSKKKLKSFPKNCKVVSNNSKNLIEIFKKKIFAVIHTATNYGRNNETLSNIVQSNTIFPLKMIDLAQKNNVQIFINTDTVLDKYLNLYSMSKNQFLEWSKYFSFKSNIKFINLKLEHLYGPEDDINKFTGFIFNSLVRDVASLNLTKGNQKRDFIYIDDVISAYLIILKKNKLLDSFSEFEVCSGELTTVKKFVATAKKIFNSNTKLNFGALEYRDGEIMKSKSNSLKLRKLGWYPNITLEAGIRKCLRSYK